MKTILLFFMIGNRMSPFLFVKPYGMSLEISCGLFIFPYLDISSALSSIVLLLGETSLLR